MKLWTSFTAMSINWTPALLREILENKRSDASLVNFTKRFIDFLRQGEDECVSLSKAAKELSIKKRRIYDIVNALEGFGFVEKISSNFIRLREVGKYPSKYESNAEYLSKLRSDIKEMKKKDEELGQKLRSYKEELQQITRRNETSIEDAYVTMSEIQEVQEFKDSTLIIIQASPGTTLEVPYPKEDIKLYLRGSTKPPLVNWIYRNPNQEALPVQELPPDDDNYKFTDHQGKAKVALTQETMDAWWSATLIAELFKEFPDISLSDQPTISADEVKKLQLPQQCQTENQANCVVSNFGIEPLLSSCAPQENEQTVKGDNKKMEAPEQDSKALQPIPLHFESFYPSMFDDIVDESLDTLLHFMDSKN